MGSSMTAKQGCRDGAPLDDAERLARLRLIRSRRVGAVTYHRLLAEHGSAGQALLALPEVARAAGVDHYAPCPVDVARHELSQGRALGARLVLHGEAEYPLALLDLADAPAALWVQGDAALLARPMVALVGARNASSLGLRMARRLAEGLGEAGFAVVSGLARGIDAAAHEAAMPTGTIAVMAGGVDIDYPQENARLAADIRVRGVVVSEQPPGCEPQARHFPLRNRIVAGLSQAVVVVEAAARSGSLITARAALDIGRDVMAVPGHPFDARASGCNHLIRDGAVLVRSPADVVEALGLPRPSARVRPEPDLAPLPGPVPSRRPLAETLPLHQMILDRLGPSPVAEDQLIRDLAVPAAEAAPMILSLELDGQVIRQAGGLLARAG
jgi:DNA processing protein